MALNSLNSMKNGIEITEFNAKFWAIFEILDFKGSQLSVSFFLLPPLEFPLRSKDGEGNKKKEEK